VICGWLEMPKDSFSSQCNNKILLLLRELSDKIILSGYKNGHFME